MGGAWYRIGAALTQILDRLLIGRCGLKQDQANVLERLVVLHEIAVLLNPPTRNCLSGFGFRGTARKEGEFEKNLYAKPPEAAPSTVSGTQGVGGLNRP